MAKISKRKASSINEQGIDQVDTSPAPCLLLAAILALSLILRFYAINLKPFHNDEGVNGFFLNNLFVHNQYAYDPHNYHGPSLYYLTLPLVYIFGQSVATLRALPIIFSIITLWLLYLLRHRIGTRAAIYAVLLLCVSPGDVFFARYFIHESLVSCLTLGVAIAAWDYHEKRQPQSLYWGAVSAGLLFATKETAAIECAILALSAGSMKIWYLLFNGADKTADGTAPNAQKGTWQMWGIATAIFVCINFVLYSSLFTHFQGVSDALHSPLYWFKRTGDEQVHPWWQFLDWLWRGDPALLCIGLCGSFMALYRRDNRFSVFAAFWTLGTLVAYSLSGYKTPWLVLNMLVPMAIMGGTLLASGLLPSLRVAVAASLCFLSLWLDVTMNLYDYDHDTSPYVYEQTQRGFYGLMNAITVYSNSRSDGGQTAIAVVTPDYWPLPWYIRRDKNAAYDGKIVTVPSETRLIVADQNQTDQIALQYGNQFTLQGAYALRPGVVLYLYQKNN